jgi:hypothetical protein
MRLKIAALVFVAEWLLFGSALLAQTPTGTISGRVNSADGESLPGVAVSVASTSLQGIRTVVSSVNGDYLVPLLPPGEYTVTFELSGFETLKEDRNVAGTQTVSLSVTMSVSKVTATVAVVGKVEPFVQTAQVATNFRQDLMATLPTNRTINAIVLMAPAVHATGPAGAFSLSGALSFENIYTVDGVVTTENLRGTPFTLYIEDALQEATVATSGISAEYGRFGGGVVNAITKSGGNRFSGSYRTTFYNDSWRAFTPFESTQRIANPTLDTRLHKTVPVHEVTLGGPLVKDRLWFFGAARIQKQESNRQTVGTLIPYVRTNDEKRYEGKVTYAPHPNHSIQATYIKINQVLRNNTSFNVMDLASLTDQGQPMDLVSLHYSGVVKPNFFVEGQYSVRHLTFTDVGAATKDLINGTGVTDQARGAFRYWSPTFCAGSTCDGDEQRDNDDIILKGSYFLSSKTSGSHHLVFGYDRYNDKILANTHANGSDYRILGTTSIIQGTTVYPQFLPTSTTISWSPINVLSKGSNLRTHSLFLTDDWRLNRNLSLNLGVRWDRNQGEDGGGQNVSDRSSFSPRLSAVWDPLADGRWALSASYSRYVAALTSNVALATTAAGNSATYRWAYQGPAINADPAGTLVTTDVALRQLFDWFFANGGTDRRPLTLASIPGVNIKILQPLKSPYANEYAGGVSRQIGDRGTIRVDGTYREYRDLYSQRVDQSTGQVADPLGNRFDLIVYENTNDVQRKYAGLTTQVTYRFGTRLDLGGNYTLSHTYGNFDGENANSGPITAQVNAYKEYKSPSWNSPEGDLSIDQRHRARIWGTYTAPIPEPAGTVTIGLLEQMGSGVPYGALGTVNSSLSVVNPGYITPPAAVDYYFTARDAFRTEATYRTDLAVNYSHKVGAGSSRPELFFHAEVLNVFNQFQLCGCGESVFNNGGITNLATIGQALRTPVNTAAMQAFNPFTTAPVQGTNWDYNITSTGFGKPLSALAYTSPRTFRFSVGVRF